MELVNQREIEFNLKAKFSLSLSLSLSLSQTASLFTQVTKVFVRPRLEQWLQCSKISYRTENQLT